MAEYEQLRQEFQIIRITEQIVEVTNEPKLLMIFTSIQSFRNSYTIIHLKKIYKRNYHKEEL